MFEHPYLTQQVTAHEQERIATAVEQRRRLIEHADQIVPRADGPVRRLLRRLVQRGVVSRAAVAERECRPCEPAVAR
ncbi:hypothetical protein [Microbacterium sufflavum]|uniref:Uncharacterized protein n=1 Tax=Microbacterium sufflavum TaxID=2851649 RepID=A0ABY4IE56_9MICO|nr:hypothetical protein [Microbacterium sufflavum]UPL10854.1 hypothetical protein KV394_06940 [Microbacterium sufflavum]